MIYQLWYWLKGYLIVRFQGANLESVLNKIAEAGLVLWNVDRVAENIIIGRISVADFSHLRCLLWGTRTNIRIFDKKGFPFILNKLKHRQVLLAGLLVASVVMFYLSGFIWFIEISGNARVSSESIMDIATNAGLQIGVAKKKLDLRQLEISLMTELEDLSWAGVTVQGSLLKIQIAERSTPEQESIQFGNLVASKDGLITQILPFHGIPQVNAGDTVRKNQLLISGQYYDLYGRLQEGRAEGVVRARVWYEAIGEAAFSRIVQVNTGVYHTNYSVTIGNHSFIIGSQPHFRSYQLRPHTIQPRIKAYQLPFAIAKNVYEEVYYETMIVSVEEAQQLAMERAWESLVDLGVERDAVEDYQVEEIIVTDQLGIRVGLIVEVEEEIGHFSPKL